ncbi:MAG: DUF5686 and carboxypeptidase regulatory-like domain-containing protein [Chitinophagales bacterium]|nr:DUF5686 and carboxypeptidase regulatory-like domain-containing protein [Chitinophagales bacterium]
MLAKRTLSLLFFILTFSFSNAQSILLKGVVIDKTEREPLPFANIVIPQLKQGFTTDENGEFQQTVSGKFDSINFTYLGFKTFSLKVPIVDPEHLQIEMEELDNELEQVVIYAPRKRQKDSTAWRIHSNVIKNKPLNRPTAHDYFEDREYVKTVASFYNFSPKLLNRKLLKPFKFVLENYDSTRDGRKYIPLVLKEELVQHYYRKNPKKEKDIILAQKVSGVEQAQISTLFDVALDEMDAYDKELQVSGKSFMMPFAEGAWFKYRIYVVDSAENEKCEWIYHIGFSPKTKSDVGFIGEAWIHEPTYAIQKIDLSIPTNTNINWINDFSATQEFQLIDNKYWTKVKDSRTTAVALTKKKKSKMVHLEQVRVFDSIKINQMIPDSIFEDKRHFAGQYKKKSDEYWEDNRLEPLRQSQKNVYFLLDTLKTTKAYKRYMSWGKFLGSGYYPLGPIEFGSLYNSFHANTTEGFRFRFNMRSNRKMSEKFWFNLYGAYGNEDKKYKYGAHVRYRYINDRNLRNETGIKYKDDYQRFSMLADISDDYDYIFNSLLRKGSFTDLIYVRDLSIYNIKEWNSTFATNVYLNYKKYKSIPGQIEFTQTTPLGDTVTLSNFKMFSPRFVLDLTPGTKFLQLPDKKMYLKGNLPRFSIEYSFSKKGFMGSDFTYHKIGLAVEQRMTSPIGWTRYYLDADKLFGNIPYPLLQIHQGNDNFLYNKKRFSNMREGEYAADQEITFLLEHHFDGYFFNKIPFIRRLQLREVFIYKMALSSLDMDKTSFINMPNDMRGLNGFYSEIGFGIENILKMFQVQMTWRLTQKNVPDVNKFAIKFWISPNF